MTPIFAVGSGSTAARILVGKRALVSFAYVGTRWLPESRLAKLQAACAGLVLDSGAFTAWQKGTPIDIAEHTAFVAERHAEFEWCAALDAIGDAAASLANWRRQRSELASDVRLVPVFHEGEDFEILDEYVAAAPLIGLGRTKGRKSVDATFDWYDDVFNRYPLGKFHAFGNGSPETLEPYPFVSFDCTTWERNSTYGGKHRWPWSRCTKETCMRAYIEAFETVTYRPRAHGRQLSLPEGAAQVEELAS